jgi:hypothetical protein
MLHAALTFYIGPLPALVEEFSVKSLSEMREHIKNRLLAAGIDDKQLMWVTWWLLPTQNSLFSSDLSRTSYLNVRLFFSLLHVQGIWSFQLLARLHEQPKSNTFIIHNSNFFMVFFPLF